MKVTREIHYLWTEWNSLPKELQNKFHFGCLVGKYHYHYHHKDMVVGLIHIEGGLQFTKSGKIIKNNKIWEACGVMDYHKWNTRKEAEAAIYEVLHETR